MGKVYDGIDERLAAWMRAQPLFFVGTAPAGTDGHVNVSPKAPIDCLHVLGPTEVAYLDVIGSGAETIAHLRENGRIVIMLCAFAGPPKTLRLHGRGEVLTPEDDGFADLAARMDIETPAVADGARSIIRVDVTRIADSCGYDVPLMELRGRRPQREAWLDRKRRAGEGALHDYIATRNAESIDGLPALDGAPAPPAPR